MTVWRMRIACRIPKATDTRSECVMLIVFPLQQWLRERVSKLCYTYIACVIIRVERTLTVSCNCALSPSFGRLQCKAHPIT